MRSEKELFKLAQLYVGLEEQFNRTSSEFELGEIKYELANIRDILFKKGYDVDTFVYYQQLYKNMTIKEYSDFIKTLEQEWYIVENTKKAVIYVRGDSKTEQEMFCYFYAYRHNIDVLFVTDDIEKVADCEECNMVLVRDASRISRKSIEYYQIVKALNKRGIEVVTTMTPENVELFINLLKEDLNRSKVK